MAERDIRTYEVTFCSRVSKWADSIFENNPALPFKRTAIEESKGINRKRSDLRVYGANKKLILAGDRKCSGLHLMCLMYAGFKRVAPEHEVQMDLNDPFLTALQMHKNGEGKH